MTKGARCISHAFDCRFALAHHSRLHSHLRHDLTLWLAAALVADAVRPKMFSHRPPIQAGLDRSITLPRPHGPSTPRSAQNTLLRRHSAPQSRRLRCQGRSGHNHSDGICVRAAVVALDAARDLAGAHAQPTDPDLRACLHIRGEREHHTRRNRTWTKTGSDGTLRGRARLADGSFTRGPSSFWRRVPTSPPTTSLPAGPLTGDIRLQNQRRAGDPTGIKLVSFVWLSLAKW